MLTLVPHTWQQVRDEFGWVRNGLHAVIERCNERWMPEDVWSALKANQAFLYAISKDGDDIGFLVLRQDQHHDGPCLFLWCCWAEPNALAGEHDALAGKLDELAARIGAKTIRFESPRAGWRGFDRHFTAVSTIYQREV